MVTDGATFRWSSLQFTSCRNSITFTFESCDTISKWFGLFTDLLYNDWEFRATSQAKFRQVKLRFRKEKRKRKKKREKNQAFPWTKQTCGWCTAHKTSSLTNYLGWTELTESWRRPLPGPDSPWLTHVGVSGHWFVSPHHSSTERRSRCVKVEVDYDFSWM